MRKTYIGLTVAAVVLAGSLQTANAAEAYSDTLCPAAVPKVVAFTEAGAGNDGVKIRAAAKAAADAYRRCAADAQSTVNVAWEPTVNYDKTRAAQFLVVAGRVGAATGDQAGAAADLRQARALAQDVAEWQPQSQSYTMSNGPAGNAAGRNSDRNGSRYKPQATDIMKAADAELAKLSAPAMSSPSGPATSPAPRTSPPRP